MYISYYYAITDRILFDSLKENVHDARKVRWDVKSKWLILKIEKSS